MAVRRVRGWCEMAASLWRCEPRSRGTSTGGRCYQAAQWRLWLRTLECVWQWFVKSSQVVLKCPINLITNPNPVYSHSIAWQYILSHPMKYCTVNIISSLVKGVRINIWVPPLTLDVTMACGYISEQFHYEMSDLSNDLALSAGYILTWHALLNTEARNKQVNYCDTSCTSLEKHSFLSTVQSRRTIFQKEAMRLSEALNCWCRVIRILIILW
jgi:hypothetical protein